MRKSGRAARSANLSIATTAPHHAPDQQMIIRSSANLHRTSAARILRETHPPTLRIAEGKNETSPTSDCAREHCRTFAGCMRGRGGRAHRLDSSTSSHADTVTDTDANADAHSDQLNGRR